MYFPSEIRNEIASHLLDLQVDPWYNMDYFPDLLVDEPAKEHKFERIPIFRHAPNPWYLGKLRLVSRDWYVTATSLMRERLWWRVKLDSRDALEQASHRLLSDVVIPKDKMQLQQSAHVVQKLELLDVLECTTYRRNYRRKAGMGRNWADRYVDNYDFTEEPLGHTERGELLLQFDSVLSNMFSAMENISAFAVCFPGVQCHHRWGEEPVAECYDLEAVEQFTSTIHRGLNLPAFQHLIDLRLSLPCTRDFRLWAEFMTKEARCRLKHLYVRIMDETGQVGNDESGIAGFGPDDDGVADGEPIGDGVPLSNLQAQFPNQEHQGHVWDFVASCENLESLSIKATHYLDLDQLIARKPNLGHLRALSLERIWADVSSITALLDAKPLVPGPPRVHVINFFNVKIHQDGGSWSEFFSYLLESCPDLTCARLHQLTYFSTHENYEMNSRQGENRSAVWTVDEADWDDLKKLAQKLIQRAGGERYYPKDLYEGIFE